MPDIFRRTTNPLPKVSGPNPRRGTRSGRTVIWILPTLTTLAVTGWWWQSPKKTDAESRVVEIDVPEGKGQVEALSAKSVSPTILKSVMPVKVAKGASPKTMQAGAEVSPAISKKSLDEIQQALEGDWTGYYQGHRKLSVRADGTATMVVEPEGLAATLLAPKLTFDVLWTVNGENLEFETLSGVPKEKVQIIVQMYGRKRSHKILGLQAAKLELLDEDGVTEYVWNRVKTESPKRGMK